MDVLSSKDNLTLKEPTFLSLKDHFIFQEPLPGQFFLTKDHFYFSWRPFFADCLSQENHLPFKGHFSLKGQLLVSSKDNFFHSRTIFLLTVLRVVLLRTTFLSRTIWFSRIFCLSCLLQIVFFPKFNPCFHSTFFFLFRHYLSTSLTSLYQFLLCDHPTLTVSFPTSSLSFLSCSFSLIPSFYLLLTFLPTYHFPNLIFPLPITFLLQYHYPLSLCSHRRQGRKPMWAESLWFQCWVSCPGQ